MTKPIDYLMDDFPDVAKYLRGESSPHAIRQRPSQHMQNATSEELTENFMTQCQQIIVDAEAEGREVNDGDVRSIVSQFVFEGMSAGYNMTTDVDDSDQQPAKRSRLDGWISIIRLHYISISKLIALVMIMIASIDHRWSR